MFLSGLASGDSTFQRVTAVQLHDRGIGDRSTEGGHGRVPLECSSSARSIALELSWPRRDVSADRCTRVARDNGADALSVPCCLFRVRQEAECEPVRLLVFAARLRADSLNARQARLTADAVVGHGGTISLVHKRDRGDGHGTTSHHP
jgi:hypothetical protein